MSKPPSTTAEDDGYGIGNFVVDTAASTAIGDMSIIFTTTDLTVGLVRGLVTAVDGSNKPTAFQILPTAGGSSNSNRLLDASWATGYVDLEDSATGLETVRLTLETTGGSSVAGLIQEGMVSGLTLSNVGSGYEVGDTIVMSSSGEAGDLSDGTVSIGGTKTLLTVNSVSSNLPLGQGFSIFTGGYGNNIKNPPKTTPTQFIVIEQYGATPTFFTDATKGVTDGATYRGLTAFNNMAGPRAYIQFYVNTTGYFKDPDGVARQGIPANNFPYPETAYSRLTSKKEIPVYILPGQTWDARLILFNGTTNIYAATTVRQVGAFLKYTLYDGPDALIAMKLLENGIPIKPQNVDEYRKRLINSHNS